MLFFQVRDVSRVEREREGESDQRAHNDLSFGHVSPTLSLSRNSNFATQHLVVFNRPLSRCVA
jgi:hypothetical protein